VPDLALERLINGTTLEKLSLLLVQALYPPFSFFFLLFILFCHLGKFSFALIEFEPHLGHLILQVSDLSLAIGLEVLHLFEILPDLFWNAILDHLVQEFADFFLSFKANTFDLLGELKSLRLQLPRLLFHAAGALESGALIFEATELVARVALYPLDLVLNIWFFICTDDLQSVLFFAALIDKAHQRLSIDQLLGGKSAQGFTLLTRARLLHVRVGQVLGIADTAQMPFNLLDLRFIHATNGIVA